MRIFGFATAILAIAVMLTSCATNYHEPAVLFHKKGLVLVENEDYKRTNDALLLLFKKYDCTIKNSFRSGNESGDTKTAEYTVSIADNSFDEFVNELRFSFKSEIAEERVTQVSVSEISSKSKIIKQHDLEYEVRYLTNLYEDETNQTIKQIRAAELQRKNEELAATIGDIDADIKSLEHSTVTVIWKLKAGEDKYPIMNSPVLFPHAGAPCLPMTPVDNKLKIEVNTVGNIERIGNDEEATIDLSGIDLEKEKVVSIPDEEGVTMTTACNPDREESVVFLTNKCEVIHVGMGPIPSIIASGNAANEQIVVTPWIDEDCNQIGFEIRAGSIESGCKNGIGNLKRLKSCNKKHKLKSVPAEIKKVKKSKKCTVNSPVNAEPERKNSMREDWKNYKWQPDTDDR